MATILVADDDQLLRAIIRENLERGGHRVLEAGDGFAALELALDERPDCLLLDVMMPLARGLEVAREVRQLQDEWYPAIVMISVRTRVTDRLNALEAGADGYIEKPFAPETLLSVIERHLAETAQPRVVDVLGPIWAATALERLTADALSRRTTRPEDVERVQELVADTLRRVLGPMRAPATHDLVSQLLWEDAIRALVKDAIDLPIPVARNVPLPDALLAIQQLIADETLARHRAHQDPGAGALPAYWADVLATVVRGPQPPPRPAVSKAQSDLEALWARHLRAVLTGASADSRPRQLDPLQSVWLAMAAERTSETPAQERT